MESSGAAPPVAGGSIAPSSDLRKRLPHQPSLPQQAQSSDAARQVVFDLNSAEDKSNKDAREKRTFGRTPNGTVFTVPQTHDMVSYLIDPRQPKNISDLFVISVLVGLVLLYYVLPYTFRVPVFAVVFLFWRACYNVGVGWLLHEQSHNNLLVTWARQSGLFNDPSTGKNPHPTFYKILKREMETKIPKDYSIEKAPIEYNTWLVFRRLVDLVLMCDFTSYIIFAVACGGRPAGESNAATIGRWVAGIILFFINLWVKLDAHRVVKDFAWYWGDFFFLIDQELTFDGVFEMAPHPMYSIGYVGYYGISMMAGSYKVLAISILAHLTQFAFLAFVESPHIEKTYNPPKPRRRTLSSTVTVPGETIDSRGDLPSHGNTSPVLTTANATEPPVTRNLIGIENIDFHRVTDCATVLIQVYFYALALMTPATPPYQLFFVINAVFWRLWYSVGLGYILDRQSKKKSWTRHFIKYGETTEEAWRQWKSIYHLSMTMCYVSFVTAALKMYSLPPDWSYGMATLRHVLGFALVALQMWTLFSIYESLGEFGWFFGDFFYDRGPRLTYSGIYIFLNNPERVIGLAGVWGLAMITWSKSIFFLAFLSHLLTLCFIQFVERPHMQRRYGQSLREYSGVSKYFKRSLPSSIQHWQGSVDRVLEDTADMVEDFFEATAPRFAAGVDHFMKDTKALLAQYPSRISLITRNIDSKPVDDVDLAEYSVTFTGTHAPNVAVKEKISGREGELGQAPPYRGAEFQPPVLEYGAPIQVTWTAPLQHSQRDWVGLYMLADNPSSSVTHISSQGRWISTNSGVYDERAEHGILVSSKQEIRWKGTKIDHETGSKDSNASTITNENSITTRLNSNENLKGSPICTGTMEFAGDKLWWTTGVFEFRYHHDGGHRVMATSKPFEIRIGKFEENEEAHVQTAGQYQSIGHQLHIMNSNSSSTGPSTRMLQNVEAVLLPFVRNCFDRDPDIAPNTVDEAFGSLVEREGKFARRVVFGLRQMFGIEFAPAVVKADGCVRNLAWRVCNARAVLYVECRFQTTFDTQGR